MDVRPYKISHQTFLSLNAGKLADGKCRYISKPFAYLICQQLPVNEVSSVIFTSLFREILGENKVHCNVKS